MRNKTWIVAMVLAVALGYMLAMLADGLEQLSQCRADGLSECHLELDGLHINAYGKE